ncbi:hypothetical protein BH11VER1_BH11VER1_06080 [soil metagenome]
MTMDRSCSTFWITPIRAVLLGLIAAALWLYLEGYTWEGFLAEAKPLMSDTHEWRVYALEVLNSFRLLILAMIIGLSFALALAIMVQSFGAWIVKMSGWFGRLLADFSPVAWGLAMTLLLARGLELPIPGLLPDTGVSQMQSWDVLVGRLVWKWLVPAITLAIPVFGLTFYSLTHQLSEWLRDPDLGKLRARGLSGNVIFYRYLMPRVWQHLVCLALPAWGFLMAAAVPVEQMLGFEGWGRRLGDAFSKHEEFTIAMSFALGGVLLALGSFLIRCLEQQPADAAEEAPQDVSRFQSKGAFISGLVLMGALLTLPKWLPLPQWRMVQHAYEAWWPEVSLALFSSMVAVMIIFCYSFAMSLSRKEPGRRKTRLTSLIRFTLRIAAIGGSLFFLKAWGLAGLVIGGAILYGVAKAHRTLKEMYASDRVLSARSVGRATYGIWHHHILRNFMPSLMHWVFWNTANVLLIVTLIRFCVPAATTTTSWGQQMQLAADGILESPVPVFAPAILLALWCLSFRLISRAFPVRTPSLRTSPFITR